MANLFQLLLPALCPSWEFFKAIEPSPRIQWRMLDTPDQQGAVWRPYRPRASVVSLPQMVLRLFWNPVWNDGLYMVSLAERLNIAPTPHSVDEINARLRTEMRQTIPFRDRLAYFQFRLVFVSRGAAGVVKETTYVAEPCQFRCRTS